MQQAALKCFPQLFDTFILWQNADYRSRLDCLLNFVVIFFQIMALQTPSLIPVLPATEKLPRARLRWKSGTCAVWKAPSPGPRLTHRRDREPLPPNQPTGSRSRGAWLPTRARGGACTGWTTRSTSCAASSPRSTTTRSFPSTKLYRWRRFTSTPWPSFSRVQSPTAATAPGATARQRRKTRLPHPRRPAERPPGRTSRQPAVYLSTSAGWLSIRQWTKGRFQPWLRKQCVCPLRHRPHGPAGLLSRLEVAGKSLHGATESFPHTPTSVTRMKWRWSSTPVRKTTSPNSNYEATIIAQLLTKCLNTRN